MNKTIVGVAVGAVLVVAIGGGLLTISRQKQLQPTNTPAASPASPADAVEAFYTAYARCMAAPPSPAASQGNPSSYCQQHTGFTTGGFAGNLAKGGAAADDDPVICASSPPQHITIISTTNASPTQAVVYVAEAYPNTPPVALSATVIRDGSNWKIDTIICAKNH